MLAQNFKTPKQLKISDEVFTALVKVLGMLERGELVHADLGGLLRRGRTKSKRKEFNMAVWHFGKNVSCIGGWAEKIDPSIGSELRYMTNPWVKKSANPGLKALIYPMDWTEHCTIDINVEQAATALRNYLRDGKPQWAEVLDAA